MIRPIVLVIRDERDRGMAEASVPASSRFGYWEWRPEGPRLRLAQDDIRFGGGEACVRDLAPLHVRQNNVM